ncbi:hypothetical protein GCK72_025132 [Caenorhabditis remanei]|uniref:Uncharacterized protein n=1 Tax=Caenorhabditis remanei TaxID=31234 RepID=A0A6A5G1X6_CAERE|nr:hypothetical protein GCK72_025132 [Caenorhabditis remanei]KAF1748665.1 hypothetical protein GCK72_025132 [Caenorhabditis remanei]
MLIFLSSALFCIVAASSSYEDSDEYQPSRYYEEEGSPSVEDGYYGSDKPQNQYETNGNNGGYGVPEYGKCQMIKQLKVPGYRTARAKFQNLEKDGNTYVAISCPNTGKPYALVAKKEGADTFFTFGPGVVLQDTVLLSSGYNLDFSARCNEKNTFARAFNGRKVSIRRVACVELAQPNTINGY